MTMGRGRKRAIQPEQIEYLKTQYAAGRTTGSLSVELGVSKSTVLNYLRAAGVDCSARSGGWGNKKVTVAAVARATELRAQGVCWKLVERELKLSESALWSGMCRARRGEPV